MKTSFKLLFFASIAFIYSCSGDNKVNPCPNGKLPLNDTIYSYNDEWYSNPKRFMVFAKSKVSLAKGAYGAYGVSGPHNLIGRIQTYQKGDSFYLDYDQCIFKFQPFETTIYGPQIDMVSIYDSSICAFDPDFTQETIIINSNDRTSGVISGKFGSLFVNHSSENEIAIEGEHSRLYLTHNGKADVNALDCKAVQADITNNSIADVYVTEVESLFVEINSSGNVYYQGNPVLEVKNNGTGQAIKFE